MLNLIQKLIYKYNGYEYIKPKYPIKRLYCGKLKQVLDIQDKTLIPGYFSTHTIEDFAIFYKRLDGKYIHIDSGDVVVDILNSCIGDYIISNTTPFEEFFEKEIKASGLTSKFKISKKNIKKIESFSDPKYLRKNLIYDL